MIRFSATIKRFDKQGEKTGWTYILIPKKIAEQLQPGNRKGFRVKGTLDHYTFSQLSLIPMGGGDFILTLNATIRKGIRKQKDAKVDVAMELDHSTLKPPEELIDCLKDEPEALEYYNSLPMGHRNYYTNWIKSAKTDPTKARRIAATINAMVNHWDFGTMFRNLKNQKLT